MSSLSDLFRVSNKLNYEIEGQINEIYSGKLLGSNDDLKTIVIPQVK